MIQSAIYHGKVFHQRFRPNRHAFDYSIFLFWLKLDEVEKISKTVKHFSQSRFSLFQFRRSDYLGSAKASLSDAVRAEMTSLNGAQLNGEVFLLGQLRTLGFYFSPVNFYFLRNVEGKFSHMLAEVSNTPWQEKHCYLVDLDKQKDSKKAFHVSPFNPMNMMYKWRITQPNDQLSITLDCHQEQKDFTARLSLQRKELTSHSLRTNLLKISGMTIKTVMGIYFQALKLWLKGTPIYPHPSTKHGASNGDK
ncbi:DUF1365 domain-containing protein [Alteromonas sp. ASW11-130]|uniref:DUF1365 domain-containing protein n=1 Tax=Alteromonas sp. ASW11-130 TaxID=3015775 RepID=UPI0022420AD6|nr:DUF1365 domain-containing protein [Alteromonas sp. ASW11-130]MCW8093020.1 DUF1365 domain-containing protein [Alteromonas sp. ASW11-130]